MSLDDAELEDEEGEARIPASTPAGGPGS